MRLLFLKLICFSIPAAVSAQQQFHRIVGGADHDRAQSAVVLPNDSILVNGATLSFGQGSADVMLVSLDPDGNTIWSNAYGSPAYDNSEFAVVCADGGFACTGRSETSPGGPTAATVFKIDSAGSLQWIKGFGGIQNDGLVQIQQTSDGGFAATGYTSSSGSGGTDLLFIRLDSAGDTIFTRSFGTLLNETGSSVTELPDGGFLLTGRQSYQSASGLQADGLIIRTDSAGDLLWARQYGDSLWEELTQARMAVDGYIVCGSTVTYGAGGFDIFLMKTDTAGVPAWGKIYGGIDTEAAYDLHILDDSSLVLSGYTESFGHGNGRGDDSTNIFLLKTEADGAFSWMQTYGDGLQDEGFHSAVTSGGGFVLTGFTDSYLLTDSSEMLLIRTDSMGTSGCHEEAATPADSAVMMPSGTISLSVLAGIQLQTLSFTTTAITPSNEDACLYTTVPEFENENPFSAYPNPFSDMLVLKGKYIVLVDAFGRKILETGNENEKVFDTTGLGAGIYFVVDAKNRKSKILIKL